jgi:hypothetical protein
MCPENFDSGSWRGYRYTKHSSTMDQQSRARGLSSRCLETQDTETYVEWRTVGRKDKDNMADMGNDQVSKQDVDTVQVECEESNDTPKRSVTRVLVVLAILWVSQ